MEIRSQPAFGATSRDVRYRTVRKRFAAVLVLLAASITGWSGVGGARASTTGIHWIVAASALKEIAQLNPTVAQAAFDNPSTYVVRDGTGTGIRSGWTSIPTASYKSYAQLSYDMSHGLFPAGVQAVLYDDERWSFTPTVEQLNPALYIGLAGQLCHSHGLALIATPAVDLAAVLSPGTPRYQAYLSLGLPAAAAKSADAVDVQAQSLETNTSAYSAFVMKAAQQARQAGGANLVVLAGLSTGPAGQTVTATQLTSAANATSSLVDGYWLNVPGQSAYCPTCGAPKPGVAVAFLRAFLHL